MLAGKLSREYYLKCSRKLSFIDCYSTTYHFSSRASKPVNHYTILGVTPQATQSEIKSAYYKLSKQYHPDVTTESKENSIKFQQITSAYEILGNLKFRKLYDKGLLPHSSLPSEDYRDQEPEESKSRFHTTSKAKRTQPTSGRTSTYNFDEWSRHHYGSTFTRRNNAKLKLEDIEKMKEERRNQNQSDNVLFFAFFLCAGLIFYNSISDRKLDNPKPRDDG